jgi:hypothetical protein
VISAALMMKYTGFHHEQRERSIDDDGVGNLPSS